MEGGGEVTVSIVVPAERLSRALLVDLSDRSRHTEGVAARADELAEALGLDEASRERLVAAAWLHDIGYSLRLQQSAFHPLDAARYLQRSSWPAEIQGLVAQHSGARFVAEVRRLAPELACFPVLEDEPLLDLLTYADQTVGPGGVRMSIESRIEEAYRRRGPASPSGRAYPRRRPYLLAVAGRVRAWLSCGGWADPRPASGWAAGNVVPVSSTAHGGQWEISARTADERSARLDGEH